MAKATKANEAAEELAEPTASAPADKSDAGKAAASEANSANSANKGKRVRLTTIDNEWDPFTQFTQWFNRDTRELGYNTCEKIADKAKIADGFTEAEEDEAIERAIDEIIKYDFQNIYRKVYEK